ncbi:hypothetical protein AMR72_16455 [Flavobacterium psychrophilum]|nr:hypothetical protein AMR72_16455 [Flavobacterium psychrophilum]AOE53956.1 hypothetical protein ALW18_16445 [Flavobacterium psychrophilum]
MKNFISQNISYLVKLKNLSQDVYGEIFDLKKGVINQYILGKSLPKIETVQKICAYHKIKIDDFINVDLSESVYNKQSVNDGIVSEAPNLNYGGSENLVAELKSKVAMQVELIETQKDLIESQKDIISNLKGQLSQAS